MILWSDITGTDVAFATIVVKTRYINLLSLVELWAYISWALSVVSMRDYWVDQSEPQVFTVPVSGSVP